MEENTFITTSAEETQKIAENIGKKLSTGDLLLLYGNLGSGKTTFVQGLAKGLGIKQRIISPTFVIMRRYELKTQNSKRKTTTQNLKYFYHVDLYRIESDKDIESVGLREILQDKNAIVAIEWAEKLGDLLPSKRYDIKFEHLMNNQRKIIINNYYISSQLTHVRKL